MKVADKRMQRIYFQNDKICIGRKWRKIHMIRANKKIGIVYCANSEMYVKELCEIIVAKKSEGYCIETVVVDNTIIDMERMLDERVFSNLDKCDYGMVFLTKDMRLEDEKFVSRPNVLIELGYLRGRLGKNHIWCITDFPHKEIEEEKYILPSDFVAEIPEEIDKYNYRADLQRVVERFIKTNNIVKLEGYNANDLIRSLILNPSYKTDYETLFEKGTLAEINKYSLKCQQEEILEMWISEKEKLDDAGQIIYLFERMVFLPFFPRKIIYGRLSEFVSVKNDEDNEYIHRCRKILKHIVEYEECKRGRQGCIGSDFYLKCADNMVQDFSLFENGKVAPIIECVTKDYVGLCYLNACLVKMKTAKSGLVRDGDEQRNYLEEAKKCFDEVIELSEEKFGDKMEIFQAFAKYNLARVLRDLEENAELEYRMAINKRRSLAESSGLPEVFKLNFTLERINAEINYYDYAKGIGNMDLSDYYERIDGLGKELEDIRQTPLADVSLFQSLEDKLNICKRSESC